MAHEIISKEEHNFIHKVIGPQLEKSAYAKIPIDSKTYHLNYCTINNGDPISFNDVIVLVCGFGSGWTGISLLGYELAKLGHQVVMVSLLGYGNSSNPPMLDRIDFKQEAAILSIWSKYVLSGRNIHWVGHSMGAAIITELSAINPVVTASLTLLNPAGFEKRNPLELAYKFALNGILHNMAFRGDPIWAELKKYLPKEKSPFAFDRLKQRLSEGLRICKGEILESFKQIPKSIPIKYLTGDRDSVFNWHNSAIMNEWTINGGRNHDPQTIFVSHNPQMIIGTYHNTTMLNSKETAKAISKFISNI